MKSPFLETNIASFRMTVHILDIVQFLPKVLSVWKFFFKTLHSLYDIWNITKNEGPINTPKIYINLRQDHVKSHIISETIISYKVLNKLPTLSYAFLFIPASKKINYKRDTAWFMAVGLTTTTTGTCLVYFYIGSDFVKDSGPCKIVAGQWCFWAGGSSFHLKLAAAL
jgi:hypothetical protein